METALVKNTVSVRFHCVMLCLRHHKLSRVNYTVMHPWRAECSQPERRATEYMHVTDRFTSGIEAIYRDHRALAADDGQSVGLCVGNC